MCPTGSPSLKQPFCTVSCIELRQNVSSTTQKQITTEDIPPDLPHHTINRVSVRTPDQKQTNKQTNGEV